MAEANKKNGVTFSKCHCAHSYQDRKYGKGVRVFNYGAGGKRCTVCGNKKII